MAITGFVLTLERDPDCRAATVAAVRADPRCSAGEAVGERWPVVVDTPSADADASARDWLAGLPGVVLIELACAIYGTGAEGDRQ